MRPLNEDDYREGWEHELWDKNLPSPGFVTDFVLCTRGTETPSIFAAWGALFTISTALKRAAWMDWLEFSTIYPNLYVVLVAPPRLCSKGTPIRLAKAVLRGFHTLLDDEVTRYIRQVKMLTGRATVERVFEEMKPEEKLLGRTSAGKILVGKRFSHLALLLEELSVLLGRQSYNIGAIDRFVDWYDCGEESDDATIVRGVGKLEKIYLTILGGATPDSLGASLPEAAFGGGFISRLTIVHQDIPTKHNPFAKDVVKGAVSELQERLAWIVRHCYGTFTIAPDAKEIYSNWYMNHRQRLIEEKRDQHLYARLDNQLLRVAMLIRAQRYEQGMEISLEDMRESIQFLEATYALADRALLEVGARNDRFGVAFVKVRDYLSTKRKIERKDLLRRFSYAKIDAETITRIVDHLVQAGEISVHHKNGEGKYQETDQVRKTNTDVYKWEGRKLPNENLMGGRLASLSTLTKDRARWKKRQGGSGSASEPSETSSESTPSSAPSGAGKRGRKPKASPASRSGSKITKKKSSPQPSKKSQI
ncbi:MAG: DUF3987 domain-containing protein [Pseudomonadota bacterium]